MNWLDFVIIGVGIVGVFIGWRVGLIGAIFNALGVVVGVFIAANFSGAISAWVTEQGASDAIATVITYLIIIVGVFFAAQVARAITKKALSLVLLGWVDSVGAVAVGLLLGAALIGAVILGVARLSVDVPDTGAAAPLIKMTGIRGTLQDALVSSKTVPVFIDVVNGLPANALGFVPGDYRAALDQVEQRIKLANGSS